MENIGQFSERERRDTEEKSFMFAKEYIYLIIFIKDLGK
jgi:hypothetical protein